MKKMTKIYWGIYLAKNTNMMFKFRVLAMEKFTSKAAAEKWQAEDPERHRLITKTFAIRNGFKWMLDILEKRPDLIPSRRRLLDMCK